MIKAILRSIQNRLVGADHDSSTAFTCGTLHYTPATLAILFGWLLWGDFTMTLMESMPALLGMQLKDHQISNQAMAFLTVTLASVCNILLNPVISYSSDRYRSRWGRRRPFLMWATPFVTIFLILIPWSPEIATGLLKVSWIRAGLELLPVSPLVLVFGVLILAFQVFNMFIGTVYYYLIPDTVPEGFIGRFYGLFRIFGIFAGIVFSWFVFGNAHVHMRLLFAFFSLLYAVSFILMCWKVKEGDYPEIKEEHGHWFSPIKNYATECFTHPRFWVIFIVYAATQWASAANVFALFFYRDEIHLTETEVGRMATMGMVLCLLFSAPFGALVDRLGSQKSLIIGLVTGATLGILCFFMIHSRLTAWIFAFLMSLPGFLVFLALGKWTVDMYPRAQYGQFASAAAIIGGIGSAALSPALGKLVDYWGNYYRMCLVIPPICYAISLVASIILYRWPQPKVVEAVGVAE